MPHLFSLVDTIERGEVRLTATTLDDVLVIAGMAEFPLRRLDAAVDFIHRVRATASQTAAQFDGVEDTDENRDQGGVEAGVSGGLGADG